MPEPLRCARAVRSAVVSRRRSPVAWSLVLPVAAAELLLLVATANRYGYHRDELYFRVAARHPAWGYDDQPALTPLLGRFSEWLFGETPRGLRVVSAVAIALVVVLVAMIARELGAGRNGTGGRCTLGRCVRGGDGGRASPLDDDLRPALLGDACLPRDAAPRRRGRAAVAARRPRRRHRAREQAPRAAPSRRARGRLPSRPPLGARAQPVGSGRAPPSRSRSGSRTSSGRHSTAGRSSSSRARSATRIRSATGRSCCRSSCCSPARSSLRSGSAASGGSCAARTPGRSVRSASPTSRCSRSCS